MATARPTADTPPLPTGVLGVPPGDAPPPPAVLPWLADPLARLLANGRPAHAVLVQGPPGVGQFEFAVAAAQAWLCEAPMPARGPAGGACGRCAACRLVQAQTHPDLLVLLPEASREPLGWVAAAGDDADDAAGGSSKRKPSRELRVDDLRRAVAFAQTTAARGGAKVVVIHPAERMNAIAANALLKTLEEPPPAVRFLVCTAEPARLLPTIRSRCQVSPLVAPAVDVSADWLASKGVADPAVLLAATGDLPLEVLALKADGIDAAGWSALPARLAAGDALALQGWPFARLVDAMLRLCTDLQRMAVGAAPRHFPAAALTPPSAARGGRGAPLAPPPLAALNAWGRRLVAAARHADHPYHLPLAIDALVADAHAVLSAR